MSSASIEKKMPRKAMLLAAGEGTRLRPLTNNVPKCMVPIAGVPVLERNIRWLSRFGIDDLLINLHYKPDAVRDYFDDGRKWGVNINYSFEETLLGTAGAVKKVEWFFDEPFFLWYGDNLSTCDLKKLYTFHSQKGGDATMALFYREDPTASGIVGFDENDRIFRFLEKPRQDQIFSHWVNAGIYILERKVLDFIPAAGPSDFSHDIFPKMLAENSPIFGYRLSEEEGLWWIDTLKDLQRIQKEF